MYAGRTVCLRNNAFIVNSTIAIMQIELSVFCTTKVFVHLKPNY